MEKRKQVFVYCENLLVRTRRFVDVVYLIGVRDDYSFWDINGAVGCMLFNLANWRTNRFYCYYSKEEVRDEVPEEY